MRSELQAAEEYPTSRASSPHLLRLEEDTRAEKSPPTTRNKGKKRKQRKRKQKKAKERKTKESKGKQRKEKKETKGMETKGKETKGNERKGNGRKGKEKGDCEELSYTSLLRI